MDAEFVHRTEISEPERELSIKVQELLFEYLPKKGAIFLPNAHCLPVAIGYLMALLPKGIDLEKLFGEHYALAQSYIGKS